MKKALFIILVLTILVGCNENDESGSVLTPPSERPLDPVHPGSDSGGGDNSSGDSDNPLTFEHQDLEKTRFKDYLYKYLNNCGSPIGNTSFFASWTDSAKFKDSTPNEFGYYEGVWAEILLFEDFTYLARIRFGDIDINGSSTAFMSKTETIKLDGEWTAVGNSGIKLDQLAQGYLYKFNGDTRLSLEFMKDLPESVMDLSTREYYLDFSYFAVEPEFGEEEPSCP